MRGPRRRGSPRELRTAAALALLGGLLGSLLAACGCSGGCGAEAPPEPRATARSAILISIDTLRADRLGCYGYARATSPHLDRLAAEGTRCANMVSQSPWTLPSHVTILTGLFPHHHGVVEKTRKVGAELPNLARELGAAGFATRAIVNSQYLGPKTGFASGFDDHAIHDELEKPADRIVDEAIDWIDARGDRRFFLFLHFYDVHSPYAPGEPYASELALPYDGIATGETAQLKQVRDGAVIFRTKDLQHVSNLYDAGIRRVDDQLGRLFAHLDERGLDASTLVVLTADHGEEFLEHGGMLHSRTLYDELLRVPLILRGPGVPRGEVIEELVMQVDVLPTVLGGVGVALEQPVDGLDLVAELARPSGLLGGRPVLASADLDDKVYDVRRMIRGDRYKLIEDTARGSWQLFDLEADPRERDDLSEREPELARELLDGLAALFARRHDAEAGEGWTEEERLMLERLGYVDHDAPPPKEGDAQD